jgi:hypothetical protein
LGRDSGMTFALQNPVRRKLVLEPHQRNWSSARYYLIGEKGTVSVNEKLYVEMRVRPVD